MPGQVFPAFTTLLLNLFAGLRSTPQYVYMGLTSGGQEISLNDGATPPVLSGYTRKKILGITLLVSGGVLTVPTQTWTFLATPAPNAAANMWFIAGSATGYDFYFSGPLNGGDASGVLPLGATAGAYTLTVPTPIANKLMLYDLLKLGSSCANNLEFVPVLDIGVDTNGLTILTIAKSVYDTHIMYAHPVNEAFLRDSQARSYSAGFVETVNAQISLTTQTC